MKKILCLILSVIIFGLCFTSCNNDSNKGKISLIVSKMYGIITPIDVYEIKGGYMSAFINKKKVDLETKYKYYACDYKSSKATSTIGDNLLQINMSALKVTIWDSNLNIPATMLTPKEHRVYYSEYWDTKTRVSFVANISFYKTIHIKLKEKSDTYQITYYKDVENINSIKSLDNYKRVVEVPKNDITKIEYFV